MPIHDFRAVRIVLEPNDFALGSEAPDPLPSDLVAPKTWRALTVLPDDVAIRTSDHHGEALAESYSLCCRWSEATGYDADPLFDPMLDAGNDLDNSIFNTLHGYYRAGFSALRSVLELLTIGACGSFANNRQIYADWRSGTAEFSFGSACTRLAVEPMLDRLNSELRLSGQSLFDPKDSTRGLAGGHARRWYGELCDYAHSRPGFADGDLWCSNGPIYVAEVFRHWRRAWLQTVSLCAVLVLLARPGAERRRVTALFTDREGVVPGELR
jgi:hypothetical protein